MKFSFFTAEEKSIKLHGQVFVMGMLTYLVIIVIGGINGRSQLAEEVRVNVNQFVQVEENTI